MPRRTKQQIINQLESDNAYLRKEVAQFNERLNEARRRTIPMHGRDMAELNFLPAFITEVSFHRDTKEFYGLDGIVHQVGRGATVTIKCEGEVIAIPAQPATPPKVKPKPELGWNILNEYADKIKDRDIQGCFIADARTLEAGFTNGDIPEDIYHSMLRMLMPKDA